MKSPIGTYVLAFALVLVGLSGWGYAIFHRPSTIKSDMEAAAIRFFMDNAHPVTGQVRDRAENFKPTPATNRMSSIASTGFGMTVMANASTRGLVPKAQAEEYVLKALRFARDHVPRRKGWFIHFIDWETGERFRDSEYSTIDTALFMGGALYATQVFSKNKEIREITYRLYEDLDFYDAMTNGGALPHKRALSMAYVEGVGYTPAQWDMYAEQRLLLVMGLGHPKNPLPPETWLAWDRTITRLPDAQEVMGIEAALFIHQYSELYIDFRNFHDGYKNYYENGRLLTAYHRSLALEDKKSKTLGHGYWGFSAGDSPRGYEVWNPLNFKGTVCIGCMVASAMYMPDVVMEDMDRWQNGPHREKIWGRYGFVDSIDLDQNWFDTQVLGITVGPAYMALADMNDNTSIWKEFMKIPEIKRGLERAASAARLAAAEPGAKVLESH